MHRLGVDLKSDLSAFGVFTNGQNMPNIHSELVLDLKRTEVGNNISSEQCICCAVQFCILKAAIMLIKVITI